MEFKPSPTSQAIEGRWDGRAHAGVFLGYVLNSGANFSKKTYLVARLSDFVGRNFHRRAYAEHVRVHVQAVLEITNWNPKAPLRFPLRPVYEWFNGTYEGMLLSVTLDPLVVERKRSDRDDRKTTWGAKC